MEGALFEKSSRDYEKFDKVHGATYSFGSDVIKAKQPSSPHEAFEVNTKYKRSGDFVFLSTPGTNKPLLPPTYACVVTLAKLQGK